MAILTLAVVIYNWTLQTEDYDIRSPKLTLQCSYNEDGFFIVNITDADRKPGVTSSIYYLEDGNGIQVPEESGYYVSQIYGLNMSYAPYNISFDDNDSNGRMSTGDSFIIRSMEKRGSADEGYIFKLVYGITGDTMGTVRLSKGNEP